MAPLVVRIPHDSPVSTKAFEALMNRVARLRELHVNTNSIRELFAATGSVSVSFLETLCLKNTSNTFILDESYIRPDTFDGASRLRHLKLTRCNLLWDSPLLSGLTHLLIHELQTSLPTTSQLLDALDRMPNLEILDLKDCLPVILDHPDSASVAPPPSRLVNLPRLSLLRLYSWFLECANVQHHISHPSNTILSLTYKISDMPDSNISCLIPVLSKVRESTKGGIQDPIIFFHIENNIEYIRLRGTSYGTDSKHPQIWSSPHIHIELELLYHINSNRTRARGISRLCCALPLTLLTNLYIDIDLDVTEWLVAFGGLPELTTIHVCGSTACGILAALMQPVDQSPPAMFSTDGKRESEPVYTNERVTSAGATFPGLKVLILESTNFSDHGLDLDDLRTCLVQRSSTRSELKLQELHLLQSYYLSLEDIGSIRVS